MHVACGISGGLAAFEEGFPLLILAAKLKQKNRKNNPPPQKGFQGGGARQAHEAAEDKNKPKLSLFRGGTGEESGRGERGGEGVRGGMCLSWTLARNT